MIKTFLTKTARSQGQWIYYRRDPFRIVPISQLAEIGDKLARNEVASSNDIRTIIGWKPSKDPKANELRNSNMPAEKAQSPDTAEPSVPKSSEPTKEVTKQPGLDFEARLRSLDQQRKTKTH